PAVPTRRSSDLLGNDEGKNQSSPVGCIADREVTDPAIQSQRKPCACPPCKKEGNTRKWNHLSHTRPACKNGFRQQHHEGSWGILKQDHSDDGAKKRRRAADRDTDAGTNVEQKPRFHQHIYIKRIIRLEH